MVLLHQCVRNHDRVLLPLSPQNHHVDTIGCHDCLPVVQNFKIIAKLKWTHSKRVQLCYCFVHDVCDMDRFDISYTGIPAVLFARNRVWAGSTGLAGLQQTSNLTSEG